MFAFFNFSKYSEPHFDGEKNNVVKHADDNTFEHEFSILNANQIPSYLIV